jgi:hypothetical protein
MIDAATPDDGAAPRPAPVDRAVIRRRVSALKRAVIGVTLAGFLALWGLVATHIAGVTAHGQTVSNSPATQSPPASSGGFFNNGNNAGNVGPGDGSGPAISSGSS